jgi:hypothetical protein
MIRHSLESAVAFPRVRFAVTDLLQDFGKLSRHAQAHARIASNCRTLNHRRPGCQRFLIAGWHYGESFDFVLLLRIGRFPPTYG